MTYRSGLAVTLLATLLTACGTSPPAAYYTLEKAEIPYAKDPNDAIILGIGPIRMPEYLDRPQIVTRGANAKLNVDDFNRWVEPLSDAQYRILAANVDALLGEVLVISFPYGRLADYEYRLVGRVDRFDMGQDGRTVLEVNWGIASTDGTIVVRPTRTQYVATGGNPDDPGSVAASMSYCLELFSRDIADSFTNRYNAE